MKKKTLMKVFLALLPAMAVLLATTKDSVKVFDTTAGTVENYSYFDLLPVENMQMLLPLAALLAVAAFVLAVFHIVRGKKWSASGVMYTACVSTCAAAVSNMLRREVMVMPNVLLPLLMAAAAVLAYIVRKNPEEKPAGERLKIRK